MKKQRKQLDVDLIEVIAQARAEERAAVVAFLRAEFDTDSVREAADCIERGEHRRDGGK